MAGQSIFCRILPLFHSGNKVLLTNRVSHVNFSPTCKRLKHHTEEYEKHGFPEKPKRPLTAFFTFMADKRPILLKQNPALSQTDVVKKLSEEWRILSLEARAKYAELAQQNKALYEKKILDYVEKLSPEQEDMIKEMEKEKIEKQQRRKLRKESRDEHKPKRPPTSFGIFLTASYKEKGNREGKSVTEFMKVLKDQWAKMADTEKNKYLLEYDKNKQLYEKELASWERRMIAAGKEQLVRTKTLKEKGGDTTIKRTQTEKWRNLNKSNNLIHNKNLEKMIVKDSFLKSRETISETNTVASNNESVQKVLNANNSKSSHLPETNEMQDIVTKPILGTQNNKTVTDGNGVLEGSSDSSSTTNRIPELEKTMDKDCTDMKSKGVLEKFRKFFKF